ncbi:hypothetical protein K0U00_32145, partial [Paenibacillus sepulcri]|nr:hypothetical protein [Paenibacillus sepulcri]
MNRWTGKASSLDEWLQLLTQQPEIMDNVTHWHTIPPKEARSTAMPADIHPKLAEALAGRGISQLFVHQAE